MVCVCLHTRAHIKMHFWVMQLAVTPGLVVLAWFERQDGGGPAGGEQGGTGCVCPRAVRADAV